MSKIRFIKKTKKEEEKAVAVKNSIDLSTINELNKSIKKMVSTFEETMLPIKESVKKLNDLFLFKDLEKIRESMSKIGKNIKYFNKVAPEKLKLLSKYGWYLNNDADASWIITLPELLKNGKDNEVNKILGDYYLGEIDNIFEKFYEKHPNRKHIFLEIKKAFEQKLYFVCITTTLTQIDGICHDIVGEKFFLKDKKNYSPKAILKIKELSNVINNHSINLLLSQTLLIAHKTKLKDYKIRLNRHEILHGIDYEYGTKINALKIISTLIFIYDMLDTNKKLLSNK